MITSTDTIHLNRFQVLREDEASFNNRADSSQMNSWPGQSSYPTTVPFNSIQFNTAAMTPASLSPSPSSVSPHEYSSMFHPFNGSMDAEERRHVSSATELSAIGNHCSANSSSVGKNQQSLQREAALNKFRMKRKDRCFEKKVRYESRKKLAEQRPRIKGQFVRQVQSTETTTTQEAPQ
ncbi:PREDICTED: two-component response regulator-like APRR5 [Brassica oleracea var. oleracea]|uniref:two-component response regulator-like APRR5 n=1 Tax=Brassica oleracea var. oleracea TaxID=109376 RepID=UPI0006A6AAE0|nr:PREDICTED: two-component response regulator-like APRR5 [Brassica oleracea var. oleracea]